METKLILYRIALKRLSDPLALSELEAKILEEVGTREYSLLSDMVSAEAEELDKNLEIALAETKAHDKKIDNRSNVK